MIELTSERATAGSRLSRRERRRLVELILNAEQAGVRLAPMTSMVPGLSLEDAAALRDDAVQVRVARGENITALLVVGEAAAPELPVAFYWATSAVMSSGRIDLCPDSSALTLRAVLGRRTTADAENLICALELGTASVGSDGDEPADLVALNGGVRHLVVGAPLAAGAATFSLQVDGIELAGGGLPELATVRAACARINDRVKHRFNGGDELALFVPLTGRLPFAGTRACLLVDDTEQASVARPPTAGAGQEGIER